MNRFILLFLLPLALTAKQIETFYGAIDVEEPVLLELIESPSFQRLKHIHQYGVSYYTRYREEYNRFDHSIGVFTILRAKGASLEEQIAGLLHDVSHTVFSHVGDWIFGKEHQDKDYQNSIHLYFLEQTEIGTILKKYGYAAEQVLPLGELFPALECALPDLCADRIDYNIQGAYYQNFITREEAIEIFDDLQFVEGRWVSGRADLMTKLARFSLFMTQDCWGGPTNYLASRWFAEAILRGVELQCISYDEIHFGFDHVIWEKLLHHEDSIINQKMIQVLNTGSYFSEVEPNNADFIVKSKFRGINPWIVSDTDYLRLTSINPVLAEEFHKVKLKTQMGWGIVLKQ